LANRAFVTPSFLRFALSVTLLDSAAIALTYTTPSHSTGAAIALLCMMIGLLTGIAHGRETYSPL
jgi:hypothetical protein